MTPLALFDYGLVVLFFLGVISLLLLVALPHKQEVVPPEAVTSQVEAKPGVYIALATLLFLLFALAFVTQKRTPGQE
ncbi:hypothetical protein [Dictyobacter kobayashii]|uniref:Uncharacterized protein n=1 Tax=Dictyobacter kobayashii TaxID=2014872 RepID=A0A402ATZ8_9CHLR|nr:hypothetical protein [Dictyobacter kobayashii]GCE22529.1 hypothetical protein KDK_63290 [Dictyobacter kobayashii]